MHKQHTKDGWRKKTSFLRGWYAVKDLLAVIGGAVVFHYASETIGRYFVVTISG